MPLPTPTHYYSLNEATGTAGATDTGSSSAALFHRQAMRGYASRG